MWTIKSHTPENSPSSFYRELTLTDRVAELSPVWYLASSMGIEEDNLEYSPESNLIRKLDSLIPTWIHDIKIDSDDSQLDQRLEHWHKDDFFGPLAIAVFDGRNSKNPSGMVWLDSSVFLLKKPEGVTELEVEYTVSDSDQKRKNNLEYVLGGPSNTALEWYFVSGENTVESVGDEELRESGRVKRTTLFLGERSGFLFGRIVNYRISRDSKRHSDPLFKRRLSNLEKIAGDLSSNVPKIETVNSLSKDRNQQLRDVNSDSVNSINKELVVFIHGTFSCSLRMLSDLDSNGVKPGKNQIWTRYEHDTFLPIHDNAEELAEHVREIVLRGYDQPKTPQRNYVNISKVLFVCHSRGGLVGVETAKLLIASTTNDRLDMASHEKPRLSPKNIQIYTYGTPHSGTPIADATKSVFSIMRTLTRTASRMGSKLLGLDPVGWVFGWAISRIHFPTGISEMSSNRAYIRSHSITEQPFLVGCAGGYIDTTSAKDGFLAVFSSAALREIMSQQDSDGVVPLDSSLAIGERLAEPMIQCGHSDYFNRNEVYETLITRMETGELP